MTPRSGGPRVNTAMKAHAVHMSPEQVAKTIVLHDGRAYVIVAVTASDRLMVDPREVVRISAATVADIREE